MERRRVVDPTIAKSQEDQESAKLLCLAGYLSRSLHAAPQSCTSLSVPRSILPFSWPRLTHLRHEHLALGRPIEPLGPSTSIPFLHSASDETRRTPGSLTYQNNAPRLFFHSQMPLPVLGTTYNYPQPHLISSPHRITSTLQTAAGRSQDR